jgi:hypothetical protein
MQSTDFIGTRDIETQQLASELLEGVEQDHFVIERDGIRNQSSPRFQCCPSCL